MKKTIASGLSIVALTAGIAVGCGDSGTGKVGENPGEKRSPSASPPTTTAPDTPGRTQGGGTTDTTPVPPPATPSPSSPSDRAPSR